MRIQQTTPIHEFLAKLIFLIVPTAVIGYFLLWNTNQYYSILRDQALIQTTYLSMGMFFGALFYSFRFRFLPTFALLLIGFYTTYKGLDYVQHGEFDAFFITVQFVVISILFLSGWLTGWGYIRLRYFSIFISVAIISSCIVLIAKSNITNITTLLQSFAPSLLFAIYIIFTTEQIYAYRNDTSRKYWWFLTRRLSLFALLVALLFGGVTYMMRKEIKETVDNYGGGGKNGENSMLKKNKDGTFDLKNYSQLRSSLGRNNELLFCAHINNFFPNTDVPNPLYLTAFYYTKFDTLTETFERDTTIPDNDLFEPDPSKLPLFFTKYDSSVLNESLQDRLRKTVDIEVYSKNLSPKTYLAPNTGYFVQPVAIEKDFRGEFKWAFRAKSYVSELNSAYFVYNSPNKQIKKFQEQRFEVLRNVTDYSATDKKFMSYYTHMPADSKFQSIAALAKSVTAKATTPVDKVIAIRDYFLSKDENGQPLYKYTDNPGVPDIPSASKLMYFLFDNHKGYCAYYAGATLFMLRALGIPSRITVGFLTVDRSDKNKGWYWYYADQAHAWVQVFFPGYGWLDFDTTVGNTDAQESPKPDGTPPMQPPKAYLAADGMIQEIDTTKKTALLLMKHMVFHDKEYTIAKPVPLTLDVHITTVLKDSIEVPLSSIRPNEEVTIVSYADALKKIEVTDKEATASVLSKFPQMVPVDEIYLKRKDTVQHEELPVVPPSGKKASAKQLMLIFGITLGALLLLALLLPYIILRYYLFRYRNASPSGNQSYWGYKAITFHLHQLGIARNTLTPMQYATQVVDPMFGSSFTKYMNVYLKKKYAKAALDTPEQQIVSTFITPFFQQVKAKISFNKRFVHYLKLIRTINYYFIINENNI